MTDREKQLRRSDRIRMSVILALCLLVALPVVVVMAASPSPDPSASGAAASASASASAETPASPGTESAKPDTTKPDTSKPDASGTPDRGQLRDRLREGLKAFGNGGFGFGSFGGRGGFGGGFGAIEITKISGNDVTLKTADGWTRTIKVTADTKVTKGGETAKVGDLEVGDQVRFSQKRNDDGTYTITSITVPQDRAGGEVTAVSGSSITIKGRGDTTQTITVNGSTTYRVGGEAGTKADVTVGSKIAVVGEADGSTFTATAVQVFLPTVSGEVTAKTNDSLTVKRRDGTTIVIHVSADTKIRIRGDETPALSDFAVGDRVVAQGTQRANGSLDAQSLGKAGVRTDRQKPGGNKPNGAKPDASPVSTQS